MFSISNMSTATPGVDFAFTVFSGVDFDPKREELNPNGFEIVFGNTDPVNITIPPDFTDELYLGAGIYLDTDVDDGELIILNITALTQPDHVEFEDKSNSIRITVVDKQ